MGLDDGFAIGGWRVYPSLNEIHRGGRVVRLEPKAVALLVYLAERPGQAVSREDLLAHVWPGVVVSDDALTQVVIKLRKALGDSARESLYIQTIPKRGYRLLAQVAEPTPIPPGPSASARPSLRLSPIVAVALILGLLVLGYLGAQRLRQAGPFAEWAGSPGESEAARAPDRLTIAVLPFESLQAGAMQEAVARGITADLTTDLSRLSDLWVVNTRSVLGQHPEGGGEGPPGVRYLVSGSAQRTADRLEVHVWLADAGSGHQLWSRRFDRPYTDLFDVQAEISAQVVDALAIQVSDAERLRMAKPYTRNLQAYESFLQGQADLLVRRKPQNLSARQAYRHAIELDPSFARAYAGLALTHVADYRNQWSSDRSASLQRGMELAQTALQIDPDIPEVYWVLGYVEAQRRHHAEAIARLEQALEHDRSFADAYALMGGINTYTGHPDRSVPLLRNAIRLNPGAGYLYYLLLGRAYFFLDDPEQAIINLNEALARNPANLEAHVYLAAASLAVGDREAAQWEAVEIRTIDPGYATPAWLQTYPMTDAGQAERLTLALADLGL